MKINYKIFKTLNQPIDVKEENGRAIEIHFMNDTPFLANYVNRGQFAVWTSDGKNYKLLVEKSYYEEFQEIFTHEMNLAWIEHFETIMKARKKISSSFWYPTLILIALVFIGFLFIDRIPFIPASILNFVEQNDLSNWILFGSIILMLIVSMFSASVFNSRARKYQTAHAQKINSILGEERSQVLGAQQETFYERYMKKLESEPAPEIEDQKEELAPETEPVEVIPLVTEEPEVTEEPQIEEPEVVEEAEPAIEEPEVVEEVEVIEVVEEVEVIEEPEVIEPVVEEVIEEPVVIEEKPVVITKPKEDPLELLNALKVDVLRNFARDRKILYYSSMNKTELLENLPKTLEDLRVVELKAIAKEKEITNYSVMTKPELVDVLTYGQKEEIKEEKPEVVVVKEVKEEQPRVYVEPIIDKEAPSKISPYLKILKVDTLRDFAKSRKVANYSSMNKTELLENLPNLITELKVSELKAVAKEKEISNYSVMTKPELIYVIVEAFKEKEETLEPVVVKAEPKIEVKPEAKEEPKVEKVEEPKETLEDLELLSVLKVDTLKGFAKDRKILYYSAMNKTELINVLPKTLEDLRVVELKAVAKEKEINNYSLMTKLELIEALSKEEVEVKKPVEVKPTPKVVKEEPKVEAKPEPKVEKAPKAEIKDTLALESLMLLSADQLRAFAKLRRIPYYSSMNKPELINALPNKLKELKVDELKAIAKEREINYFSVMNKTQLLKALEEKKEVKEDKRISEDLEKLLVEELRNFARDRKILYYSSMNKTELLEKLPHSLEDLRVDELKAIARNEEIPNFSTMVKEELISAIKGKKGE